MRTSFSYLTNRILATISLFSAIFIFTLPCLAVAQEQFEFGFSKVDITPTEPLRLSGYGSRSTVFEGIETKLNARVCAIRDSHQKIYLLVSVDTIGFSDLVTQQIYKRINESHKIPRDRFVICCTHSHTAPQISDSLTNIFAAKMTAKQTAATRRYTDKMISNIGNSVQSAIDDLKPGKISAQQGVVNFARNRRVLRDGLWSGFGVNPAGPSDFSLPLLKITNNDGTIRGLVFNYACHCTTFSGNDNRVDGDWAGYASTEIEGRFPGVTAICTIGCGADQNPYRYPEAPDHKTSAIAHGHEIAVEVARLCELPETEINQSLKTSYGHAGLPVDRPSKETLTKTLESSNTQDRQHAQNMLEILQRMRRLPETYPAPLQVWKFGDQLCMVFMSGEVVVDYGLRLKKELKSDLVWVSAYCNDVYGYLASERMRAEGGYEVSKSMVYYNQPGPWSTGTEEVVIRRIHELATQGNFAGPFTPEQAKQTFTVPDGFVIELVAAEPLIQDPVNFAVGPDGRLWVVEMGDYPRGPDDQGAPGGRVKVLQDTDGDGRYDKGNLFLDGLYYPNGVMPWRDGVLISGAPSILFARDTDGDHHADEVTPIYSGFEEENPQHRISGFAYGLDNWLYLASGTSNHQITSSLTGETIDMAGRDLRIQPANGAMEAINGRTQFGRNRDDWGDWFGGDNSRPLWHYVIPDRYLARNPFFAAPTPVVHLLTPSLAPPVFPTSRTVDRFNDLFALNRFTSACSPTVFRDTSLGADVEGAVFISEPVHNLVHRSMLTRSGVTFVGARHKSEQESEFLSSTDQWFRPTTTKTGPDGSLWVADMYRFVIEHPEWIPDSWQERINLRAGDDKGRIWRVYRKEQPPSSIPQLSKMNTSQLVKQLSSDNGWSRDTAQQLLIQQNDPALAKHLAGLFTRSSNSLEIVHALGVLQATDQLTHQHLLQLYQSQDARVIKRAILLTEPFLTDPTSDVKDKLLQQLLDLKDHPDINVRLQLILSLGESSDSSIGSVMSQIAIADIENQWIRTALLSSSKKHANAVLTNLLANSEPSQHRSKLIQDLISTSLANEPRANSIPMLESITQIKKSVQPWQIEALASFDRALRRQKMSLSSLRQSAKPQLPELLLRAETIVESARRAVEDPKTDVKIRANSTNLMGRGFDQVEEDLQRLTRLLTPQTPVELQLAAVQAISQIELGDVAAIYLNAWKAMSPKVRSEALSVLLSKQAWQESLLGLLETKALPVSDLDATSRMRLLSSSKRALRDRARVILAASQNRDRKTIIDSMRPDGSLNGDLKNGAEVFRKTCSACHKLGAIGKDVAPSLASLKDKSDDSLLTAIFDPNQAVEGKYKTYVVATVEGQVLSGLITSETPNSINLSQANGTEIELLRIDIEEMSSSGVSFMPEGLEKDLSTQSLADLFSFIRQVE